jgi:hypothetical protein
VRHLRQQGCRRIRAVDIKPLDDRYDSRTVSKRLIAGSSTRSQIVLARWVNCKNRHPAFRIMPQSCKIDEEGLKRSDSPVFGFAIAIAKCGLDPGLREDVQPSLDCRFIRFFMC